jgi:3'(2'), 5'-bisphosphate nucleotidase
LGSRSHQSQEALNLIEKLEKIHHETTLISRGSSLKFCTLACGEADFYPRLGRTMEWDTAAGHAIAENAGFEVLQLPGLKSLEYNKNDLANPWFLVVKPGKIEEWKTRGLHLENTIKKGA